MVIGIDASRSAASKRTGTEAYAYHLINALIPLASKNGHRLRLYFNQPPPEGQFANGGDLEHCVLPFPRLWTHVRLARELHWRPPDVFFTPAHVIPFSYRRPAVATIHDLGFHFFPEAHTWAQATYLRWSTRHNAQRSRLIIADSLATKNDLLRLYGLKSTKIVVIHPGIDRTLRPVTDTERLESVKHKYAISSPYLLYIGTLQPRKNLRRLMEAYITSEVEHQLVLAGSIGWHGSSILDAVVSYQTPGANRINLPGYILDEDKAALISGADALLYPSLYEGFGFPVLEANACGTPVLCADTSSLPEIAADAALLVDPLDTAGLAASIRRIIRDRPLRERLTQAGLSNINRFSWKAAAKGTLRTLESAAG